MKHSVNINDVAGNKAACPRRSISGIGFSNPFFAGRFVSRVVLAGKRQNPKVDVGDQHICR